MTLIVRLVQLVTLSLVLVCGVLVAALPVIEQPVTTEFGTYSPLTVNVTPAVADISVAADLSNVAFIDQLGAQLDQQARQLLADHHFVAVPAGYKQPYDIYNWASGSELPSFVTTDAMLHTFHVLYDYCLRILETERFIGYLDGLNEALLADIQKRTSSDSALNDELDKLVAYVIVASTLANPAANLPQRGQDLARQELELIGAHEGGQISPLFGLKVDYSQFVARGHYTRSQELSDYFLGMMWYGRLGFRLRPGDTPELIELGRGHTRIALNLVSSLAAVSVDGVPALEIWEKIYRPTAFFVGSADDLTPSEYAGLAAEVYGIPASQLTPEQIADPLLLDTFIERALELRAPRISSSLIGDGQEAAVVTKGLRMMSQRFIPDSYMFWKLVHPNVQNRMMPRGLDVMAVLGSEEALKLLGDRYNELDDPSYAASIDSLKREFEALPAADWAQNLYYNWLYCLAPLLEPKGVGYPSFMRDSAWRRKELATALGSWAELRHDTILYAKQSYTSETSMPLQVPPAYGYVEPEPEVFARLAALARYMRTSFQSMDLLPEQIGWRLEEFDNLAASLKAIAGNLLSGGQLSSADQELIDSFGERTEALADFSAGEQRPEWESETDDQMAVVADVHTDPNSGDVLEVAVGNPLALYVIVPTPAGPSLAVGAMFAYHEFRQPMSDRLTDEAWQSRLSAADAPSPAEWMSGFLARPVSVISKYRNYPSQPSPAGDVRISLPSGTLAPGELLNIELEYHQSEGLRAQFIGPNGLLAETALRLGASGALGTSVSTVGWPAGSVRVEIYQGETLLRSAYLEFAPDENPSDLNRDGKTGIMDMIEFLRLMRSDATPDLNNDGRANIFDLLELLRQIKQAGGPAARLTGLGECTGAKEEATILAGESDRLTLTSGGGTVSFTHESATYNCCLDRIDLSLERSGNTIVVVEHEIAAEPCRCICDYEVRGEITGLSTGSYTVEVVSAEDKSSVLCTATVTVN